ncbi:hypothetical protein MMC15_008659 [Xylographa vitiligo]|nr:hypothetical protein [Xylographa vitiligo]
MAVFVGPASAVAIIPQLDWWKVPFGWADEGTVFIPISIEDLWPNNLTSANVPEPECYSSLAFQYRHCPSAGLAAISRWDPQNWRVNPNITISISNSSMVRHLVSVASRLSSGYTQSSTLSDLFARDLSCAFDIGAHSGILGLTHVNRPLVEEIMPEGKSLRKPFVEVECAAYNVYSQEAIQFPHGRLRGHSLMDNFEDQWSVPEEAWNSSASLRDPIKLSWVDLASRSQAASIGLVFVANIQVQTFPETIFQRQIIPCTVSARWIPVKMWIDPTNDNSIHENLIDVVKSAAFQQQSAAVVGTRQISIHESWANALNIQPEGFNYTALELMVASSPFGKDVLPEYLNTVSHFVGMYIAEGLARLKSGLPSYYHSSYLIRGHNGTTIDTLELPTGICPSLCNGPWGAWRPPIYMNKLGWTQIDFIARRYGYGWGLKGIPVQLAAIVLILDACLCVIHITRILSTGWTSSMLSTEGELTALALNSAPTEKLKNTCAGIERIGTWKKMIKIREVGNQHLELVVKDDNNEEEVGVPPIPNKKYGVMPGGYRKVSKRKVKSNSK